MLKITDRVILKTYDGKVIVRPQIKYSCEASILFNGMVGHLHKEGIKAWNNGEKIEEYHFFCYSPVNIPEGIIF